MAIDLKPKRIQRKRTRGWKMPPNTVCVTRPGRWGNPYKGIKLLDSTMGAGNDANSRGAS